MSMDISKDKERKERKEKEKKGKGKRRKVMDLKIKEKDKVMGKVKQIMWPIKRRLFLLMKPRSRGVHRGRNCRRLTKLKEKPVLALEVYFSSEKITSLARAEYCAMCAWEWWMTMYLPSGKMIVVLISFSPSLTIVTPFSWWEELTMYFLSRKMVVYLIWIVFLCWRLKCAMCSYFSHWCQVPYISAVTHQMNWFCCCCFLVSFLWWSQTFGMWHFVASRWEFKMPMLWGNLSTHDEIHGDPILDFSCVKHEPIS